MDRDFWTRAVCEWTYCHPHQQVRVYFALLAFYVRQERGDLNRALAIYAEGSPGACDYTWLVQKVWRRHWRWPEGGRLARLDPEARKILGLAVGSPPAVR